MVTQQNDKIQQITSNTKIKRRGKKTYIPTNKNNYQGDKNRKNQRQKKIRIKGFRKNHE